MTVLLTLVTVFELLILEITTKLSVLWKGWIAVFMVTVLKFKMSFNVCLEDIFSTVNDVPS